jgi:lysophospholipase L1-like esterase
MRPTVDSSSAWHRGVRTAARTLAYFTVVLVISCAGPLHAQTHWVGSWAASQQLPEPQNSLSNDDLRDATLRQIVHLSLGGAELRVHISNRFGTAPLRFTGVHIARPVSLSSPQIVPGTDHALTFSGAADVTIPSGADYISDPVTFTAAPLSDLAITLHLDTPPARQTGHPGSRATSYLVHRNELSALDLPNANKFEHWYFISGVDVAASSQARALITLGDSITDGHASTTNGNDRWPDDLARRLEADQATKDVSVLNHGIGGNRLLLDGLGPNAMARFDHDILAQSGVRYVIVLEGVNDLGMLTHDGEVSRSEHEAEVHRIISAYQQIITRAHAHGIDVIGGTLMPFTGFSFYHPGPDTETDRQTINTWIRAPGHFDAVVDFDKVGRDPEHPDHLLAKFDSGDHIHPSPVGYAAMADAVPLSLFVAQRPPQIAFSFDDLPAHGPLPPDETRMQIATKIIKALHDAHLPPVYGFVNGIRIQENTSDTEVLNAWRTAGFPLGNHSWSHMNLSQNTLQAFETDVSRDEPLLESLMEGEDWHWFRFPYLAEGNTPEKRAGIREFFLHHGYRIAGVTMSFGDYRWNEPYARCMANGDQKGVALLKSSYLEAADKSIGYYRQLSHTLLGRDIPYVLLMHIGALDAEMLPQLLDLYRSRGFQFITLPEAERDQFYREDTDLNLPPSPDTLEGVAAEKHLPFPPEPQLSVQPESLCK